MGRVIAIDYGTKRVGLAVTDELRLIATRLTSVHSSELVSFLMNYTAKEQVDTIVVGLPKSLSNQDTNATKEAEKMIKNLERKFIGIKVEAIDERFTSSIASQTIANSGIRKKQRQKKSLIDEVSAVILLQDYLQQCENGLR